MTRISDVPKSIAIVGGGTSGIAALKGLVDLPESARRGWTIDLFEKRETLVTFPNDPYPAGTNLFPLHAEVRTHLVSFAEKHDLVRFFRFNHEVTEATFESSTNRWTVVVVQSDGVPSERQYDHLIVANGHNTYPRIPSFPGSDLWLGASPTHSIVHAAFFRDPTAYTNQIVVVVGNGATGRDLADRIALAGGTVYHSWTSNPTKWSPLPHVTHKPRISHFTPTSIVFTDHTTLSSPTKLPITILLGTGYELRVPFLPHLSTSSPSSPLSLSTNLRRIRPLYKHLFPLDPSLPFGSIAFVGLPVNVSYCALSYIQGLAIAHVLVDPKILPMREEMMEDLEEDEKRFREAEFDPMVIGQYVSFLTFPRPPS
ncbi:hypothetical protein RQP46_007989 [Phenoliferia psychrophenolica]